MQTADEDSAGNDGGRILKATAAAEVAAVADRTVAAVTAAWAGAPRPAP